LVHIDNSGVPRGRLSLRRLAVGGKGAREAVGARSDRVNLSALGEPARAVLRC